MNNYIVYMHTTPDGLVYIGITRQTPPERRWGRGGCKYKNNPRFWSAIQKYGWDQVEHDILFENISADSAKAKERSLISLYDAMNPKRGYNHTSGGDVNTQMFSESIIQSLRQHTTDMWKNPEIRNKIVSALQGHPVSDLTRQNISKAKTGKLLGHPSPLKGRCLSASHRLKLKGHIPWCKGKTKADDPRLMEISIIQKGRKRTDSERQKLSLSHIQLYKTGYKPVWVTNGYAETLIDVKLLDDYISQGWNLGRLNIRSVYMTDGIQTKKVSASEVAEYELSGWYLGKDPITTANINKSKIQYIYTYDSMEFTSCKSLFVYLQSHGYPCISLSSVIKLASGGIVNRYSDLCNKILRQAI